MIFDWSQFYWQPIALNGVVNNTFVWTLNASGAAPVAATATHKKQFIGEIQQLGVFDQSGIFDTSMGVM